MKTHSIYSGIYKKSIDGITEQFISDDRQNAFDSQLLPFYLWETMAHNFMLAQLGLVPEAIAKKILAKLLELMALSEQNEFRIDPQFGDVHENVEHWLTQSLGSDAGWFHLARSRNDQVTTDQKLITKQLFFQLAHEIESLATVFVNKSEAYANSIFPGFTHSRAAMPSSFGFWWQAHLVQLVDAMHILQSAYTVADVSPLGAGASYGTNWKIDPKMSSEYMAFSQPMVNSLAAIQNRGQHEWYFLSPLLGICLLLSRLMEDVIYWSSPEVGLISFSEGFTTGSSIMPQKMNPDIAEKIRSKVGVILGSMVQLATALKGTPSGYNRDSAESKEVIISAFKETIQIVKTAVPFLQSVILQTSDIAAYMVPTLATKLADQLVLKWDIPFRTAHKIVGASLAASEYSLQQVTSAVLESQIKKEAKKRVVVSKKWLQKTIDPKYALSEYSYLGSPDPTQVLTVNSTLSHQIDVFSSWANDEQAKFQKAKKALITSVQKFTMEKI